MNQLKRMALGMSTMLVLGTAGVWAAWAGDLNPCTISIFESQVGREIFGPEVSCLSAALKNNPASEETLGALCSADRSKFSDRYQAYAKYEKLFRERQYEFDAAKKAGAGQATLSQLALELSQIQRDWDLAGFRIELSDSISRMDSMVLFCRSDR